MPDGQVTRRDFTRRSTTAAFAATAGYFTSTRKSLANKSANERLLIGQIGCGGMGNIDAGSHGVGDDQAASFFARTPRKGCEIPRV